MTTYTGRASLATALRIKLMEVFYVLGVQKWFSILHSQTDASGAVDLGYPKGSLLAGGELVGTLPCEHPPKH
jgi:uncharacterized membrane protein YphA (DoxX/SURF4 family)